MAVRALSTLGLVGSVAAIAATRVVASTQHAAADRYEDTYFVPPASYLPWLSLGHREALADLLWCRALVYQGEEMLHAGELAHVFDYADAIFALDPDFVAAYVWISSAGIYTPGGTDLEAMQRTVAYLQQGRARFPQNGQLAWLLGATYTFEMAPYVPEEQRESIRLQGLEHLMDASRLGAAPEWMVLSSTSMLSTLGQADRAVEHLEEMYALVSDDALRQRIAERIASIRSEAYGAAFVEANDELEADRARAFPYLAPDLYLLIAPTSEEDREAALRNGWGAATVGTDLGTEGD